MFITYIKTKLTTNARIPEYECSLPKVLYKMKNEKMKIVPRTNVDGPMNPTNSLRKSPREKRLKELNEALIRFSFGAYPAACCDKLNSLNNSVI